MPKLEEINNRDLRVPVECPLCRKESVIVKRKKYSGKTYEC